MNSKLQELVDKGVITIQPQKPGRERIEVFVEGDINDGDYVRDTHEYTIKQFLKPACIDMYTRAVNEDYGYIDDVEDEELQDFLRDISPSSPSDGCDVHTLDTIMFTYIDAAGNSSEFTLNTVAEARDFKIEKVVE